MGSRTITTNRYVIVDDSSHVAYRNVADIAERLGVTESYIRRIAKARLEVNGHHLHTANYITILKGFMKFAWGRNDDEHMWIVNTITKDVYYNILEASYYLDCNRDTVYKALREKRMCKGCALSLKNGLFLRANSELFNLGFKNNFYKF
jgi:hypothetical protein